MPIAGPSPKHTSTGRRSHALRCPSHHPHRPCRQRRRRLVPSDRRAVDDQHRHRRRRRRRCARWRRWRAPGASWCGSRSTTTRRRRAVPEIVEATRPHRRAACRSSATSTTTATCCSRGTPTARGARQVPHQPGQRRRQARATSNFRAIIEVALANDKPVRIGVNWGSLDQDLLTEMMDANARWPSRATRAT